MACLSHIISKLLQVVWHFVGFFFHSFFCVYNSHNFYIFVVSGCRIRTLNHVNRQKSFTRELFRKFNLTNSNGFSVYTFCHSNYNNKKKTKRKHSWHFKLTARNKNCFREKFLLFFMFDSNRFFFISVLNYIYFIHPIKKEVFNFLFSHVLKNVIRPSIRNTFNRTKVDKNSIL